MRGYAGRGMRCAWLRCAVHGKGTHTQQQHSLSLGARCQQGGMQRCGLRLRACGVLGWQRGRGTHEGQEVAHQHAPQVSVGQGRGRCSLVL